MSRLRAWLRLKLGWIPRPVRRVIIAVIGGTVLLLVPLGALLPIMPGWIFLPLALAILAVEFAWAARWLKKIRKATASVQQRVRGGFGWRTGAPEIASDQPVEVDPSKRIAALRTPPVATTRPSAAA